jgi:hypothetical protein
MDGAGKEPIVEKLEALNIPFIDVGMGVYVKDGRLGGLIRTTASTPNMRKHVREKKRIDCVTADEVNEYETHPDRGAERFERCPCRDPMEETVGFLRRSRG